MIAKSKTSLRKRFMVKKSGKIMHRVSGQAHFNAREPGKVTRAKRRDSVLAKGYHKTIRQFTHS